MTNIYLIRHAQPDRAPIYPNAMRPLTEKGLADTKLVAKFLQDKKIDLIFSSPYKRAFDTVAPFAKNAKLEIQVVNDFREREKGDLLVGDTVADCVRKQFADFSYKSLTAKI